MKFNHKISIPYQKGYRMPELAFFDKAIPSVIIKALSVGWEKLLASITLCF
jgi:hypothetical protein